MTLLACLVHDAYSLYDEMEKQDRPGGSTNAILGSISSSFQFLTDKAEQIRQLYLLHCRDDSEAKLAASIRDLYVEIARQVKADKEAKEAMGVAPGPSRILCLLTILNACAMVGAGHIEPRIASNEIKNHLIKYDVCFKHNSRKELFLERMNHYLQAKQDQLNMTALQQQTTRLQTDYQELKAENARPMEPPEEVKEEELSTPSSSSSEEEDEMTCLKRKLALQTNAVKALHKTLKQKDQALVDKESELSKLRVDLDYKTRMLASNTAELNLFRRAVVHQNPAQGAVSAASQAVVRTAPTQ